MSVTRGQFLRSLGATVGNGALSAGVAAATHLLSTATGKRLMTSGQASPAPAKPVEFLHHGPTEGNKIALTFDDGPTPGVTDS